GLSSMCHRTFSNLSHITITPEGGTMGRSIAVTLLTLALAVPSGLGGAKAEPSNHHRAHRAIHNAKHNVILPSGIGHASTINTFEVRQPQLHVTPAFIPGKGMLGTPCNLPTSACPNEMRDGG